MNRKTLDKQKGLQILKDNFEKCWAYPYNCQDKPIKAHSVSNKMTLDMLAFNNHVVVVKVNIKAKALEDTIQFKREGRNNATTFKGLCSTHDSELFKLIDTEKFDADNAQCLFLHGYRSVFRSLHMASDTARKILRMQDLVDSDHWRIVGEFEGEPLDEGTYRMMTAWQVFRCKTEWDDAFTNQQYDAIQNIIFSIKTNPTVAVSSMFTVPPCNDPLQNFIVLNVLPISNSETKVVFSWIDQDESKQRNFVKQFTSCNEQELKHKVTDTILRYTENFVMSPVFFDSQPEKIREVMRRYFASTMLTNDGPTLDAAISLFA